MKPVRLMLLVMLVSTTFASAQDGPWGERRRGWGYRRGGMERFEQQATDQEWAELGTFMKEISPKRWEIYENLPENSPVRDRTRLLFLSRYRMLEKTKTEDPTLYNTLVERVKVEDTIFATVANIKRAVADNSTQPEIDNLRSELRAKVTELVDLGMKERRHRIERMERTLKAERQKLQGDEQNREELIAKRTKQYETGGEWQRSDSQQPHSDRDDQPSRGQAQPQPDPAAEPQPGR